jgi:hypothetical protein
VNGAFRRDRKRPSLLELLGPPTFGTQRLLAHWATRDRAVKVSEEELMAEVRGPSRQRGRMGASRF